MLFGTGTYLVKHPDAVVNPFFISLPGGTGSPVYWIMFVLSTLTSIIASQALILSVFSITSQLINLDCFPKLRVVHVSHQYAGKVYIPTVNWMLMIGVVCTAAGFQNSNNVTAAYGLGISLDLIVTSCLIIICLFYVYNTNVIWPLAFALIFIPLEACLVIANLKKVPHGAWFPLMMAVLFGTFLATWRWARSKRVEHELRQQVKIGDLYPFFQTKSVTVDLGCDLDLGTRGRQRVTVIPQPAKTKLRPSLAPKSCKNTLELDSCMLIHCSQTVQTHYHNYMLKLCRISHQYPTIWYLLVLECFPYHMSLTINDSF